MLRQSRLEGGRQVSSGTSHKLSPRQISRSSQSCMLSPHINVSFADEEMSTGEKDVWAAVEVSGKLSHIAAAIAPPLHIKPSQRQTGSFIEHKLG